MEIKFNCNNPTCQQKLAVDESYLGRSFPCPACGVVLLVPSPIRRISAISIEAEPQIEIPHSLMARIIRLLIAWGIGLAVCALLMASLRIYASFTQINSTRRLGQIIKDVTFPENIINVAPVSNRKETMLLYARDVPEGTGLFLANLASQERKQIELIAPTKVPPQLIGWSPDDRYLVFAEAGKKKQPNQQIMIRDGSSGAASDSFELPDSLEQGAWLSTNSLVLYARHKLYLYNFQESYSNLGRYGKQGLIPLPFDSIAVPSSLVPIDGRAVAYANGTNIFFLNISDGRTTQLTHLTNATIGQLDYSPENGSFLFSLTVTGKRADPCLYRFNPKDTNTGGLAQFTDRYNFERIYNGKWIAQGAGLVYAGPNFLGVSLSSESISFHTNLFAGGRYQNYSVSPRGDKIFAVASLAGEPLGIWGFDINYGDLENVVSPKEHLAVSQWATPASVEITRTNGAKLVYSLLPPPDLTRGRKHPAVLNMLGNNPYDDWPQVLANVGVFSVSIRPKTPDDAQAIVDDLLNRADIDPQQIYIAGQGADAALIKSLVKNTPAQWRGVILLRPAEFQSLPATPADFPPLLILGGRNNDLIYSLKAERFVRAACQKLVPVRLVFDEDIARSSPKADLNQERYKAMAKFILTGVLN